MFQHLPHSNCQAIISHLQSGQTLGLITEYTALVDDLLEKHHCNCEAAARFELEL